MWHAITLAWRLKQHKMVIRMSEPSKCGAILYELSVPCKILRDPSPISIIILPLLFSLLEQHIYMMITTWTSQPFTFFPLIKNCLTCFSSFLFFFPTSNMLFFQKSSWNKKKEKRRRRKENLPDLTSFHKTLIW